MLFSKQLAVISSVAIQFKAHAFDFKDDNQSMQSIVGGEEIERGSRPYLVALGNGNSSYWGQRCGGSLISPNAVMTAAHCLFGGTKRNPVWDPPEWIELNRHDLLDDDGVIRLYLEDSTQCEGDAVYHPGFDPLTTDNDVAILFLPEPISNLTTVTLNTDPNVPIDDAPLDISGW